MNLGNNQCTENTHYTASPEQDLLSGSQPTIQHQPDNPNQQRRIDIDDLDAKIGTLSRSINSATYELLVLIREFDERAGWLKSGFLNGRMWLQWRCDLSVNAAREKLRIAHALKELPLMCNDFEAGKLSYSKVRALTRVATNDTEAELIAMAHNMSALHVEQHCRQRTNASSESSASAVRSHASRSLRSWRNDERGVTTITIELPVEEAALFEKAVDKASASLSADAMASHAAGDTKTSWGAIQADAAVFIAKHYLSGVPSDSNSTSDSDKACNAKQSSPTAEHYQVMIHIDEAALTGRDGCCGKSELPIETIKRLCCDGSIIPVLENTEGEPLSVGRKLRTVNTAIRRGLWARDKGCAFPGCTHTRFVDGHHIKHWADGGETSLDNMLLLCSQHHRLVHEGGYTILKNHTAGHYFLRPDGKAVPDCGYHSDDWKDDYSANVSIDELYKVVPDNVDLEQDELHPDEQYQDEQYQNEVREDRLNHVEFYERKNSAEFFGVREHSNNDSYNVNRSMRVDRCTSHASGGLPSNMGSVAFH